MKELFLDYLYNFWALLNTVAAFILLGVLITAALKLLSPDTFIRKHLKQNTIKAIIKASLLGMPLSSCSLSVLPFINTLRKSRVSKAAVQSLLITTQMTSLDSLLASYGVFGWVFALYQLVTAIFIALISGFTTLLFAKEDANNLDDRPVHLQKNLKKSSSIIGKPLDIKVAKAEDKKTGITNVLSYAFDNLLKDMARPLIISIMTGALIITFTPALFTQYLSSSIFIDYSLALLISIPLAICSTALIPLGLALLAAGSSPGAIFIFLTIGSTINLHSIKMILKSLGRKSLGIYLSSILISSFLFGFLFDSLLLESLSTINLLNIHKEDPGFVAQVSSLVLLFLSLKYIFNKQAIVIGGGGCNKGGCSSGGHSSH